MSEVLRERDLADYSHHELILDGAVPLPGLQGTTYDALFDRYVLSDWGLCHANELPRYSNRYAYDRRQMLADLGPDVHPVEHMRYTHDEVHVRLMYVQNCLAEGDGKEQFAPRDIVAGRLAALFHDIGECAHEDLLYATGKTVGDLAWNTKTDDDEAAEAAIRQFFYSKLYADIPADFLEQAEAIIRHTDDHLAPAAFATSERIGYYLTAIRAGYHALVETAHRDAGVSYRTDASYGALISLAKTVTDNHRDALRAAGERFPFATLVLEQHETLDQAIHERL
jgi:hypothetical protein